MITSAFKSSIEILLFQWIQVSKHPKWKPQVDAWFSRFKVSINLNIFYVNLFSLLKLLKFEWERADNNVTMRVWENHITIR